MNCKPGDLAVIVSGLPQNVGGMVRVLRAYPTPPDNRHWWSVEALSSLAYTTLRHRGYIVGRIEPGETTYAADADLRPIRDRDGEDETLTWAGKPEGVTA